MIFSCSAFLRATCKHFASVGRYEPSVGEVEIRHCLICAYCALECVPRQGRFGKIRKDGPDDFGAAGRYVWCMTMGESILQLYLLPSN